MKKRVNLRLAIVIIMLAASPISAEVLYNVTDLGRGRALAINNNGQIVGHCVGHATLFDSTGGGNNIVLDKQDGVISYAFSINDNGQIVGNIEPLPDESSAVIFDPTGEGNHTYLSAPSGFSSCAYSINNKGQVVGYVKSGPSTPRDEFVHVATLFDSTGGDDNTYLGSGWAMAINNNGQIVGHCRGHATLFDPTGEENNIDLGALEEAPFSWAWSINNKSQIVGWAEAPIIGVYGSWAILFDSTGQGNNINLGSGAPKSINDNGQIVGGRTYGVAPPRSRAILFDSTGEGNDIDLNNLIDPNLGWDLGGAACINNNGWIVGSGRNPDGHSHAYLLKPISMAIEAEIDINPDTLNMQSKGKWITCHIRLPEDYDVADIDANSVFLEDAIQAELLQVNEQSQIAMAKFNRSEVQDILEPGEMVLTVSGELTDGTIFEGMGTIRIIDKGNKK